MHLLSAQFVGAYGCMQPHVEAVSRGRSLLCCGHRQNSSLIFKLTLLLSGAFKPTLLHCDFSFGPCTPHVNRAGEPRKLNDHNMTISCTDLWLSGWVSVPSRAQIPTQVGTVAPLLPLTGPYNSCKGGIGLRCCCGALEPAAKVAI